MRLPLTIAAAQPECLPYDVAANAAAHAAAVRCRRPGRGLPLRARAGPDPGARARATLSAAAPSA
jgi:hypothetical protein